MSTPNKHPMANFDAVAQNGLRNNNLITAEIYIENNPSYSSPPTHRANNLNKTWQWSILEIEEISHSPSTFRIDDVIADTISAISRVATPKGVDIILAPNHDAIVHAEQDIIYSMTHYLVSNLVKLSQRDEKVRIASKIEQNMVLVSLCNSSIAMSEAKLHQLFHVSPDSMPDSINSGTVNEMVMGVEFLLCQRFAERNKGVLSIMSGAEQGITFTFALPKAA